MFRRAQPYFYAFDLLELDGEDLRTRPLLERKRRLAKIIPYDLDTSLRLLGHVPGRGRALFRLAAITTRRASSRSGPAAHTTSTGGRRPG